MGHFGVAKTLGVLQEHFYWPHMKRDCDAPNPALGVKRGCHFFMLVCAIMLVYACLIY